MFTTATRQCTTDLLAAGCDQHFDASARCADDRDSGWQSRWSTTDGNSSDTGYGTAPSRRESDAKIAMKQLWSLGALSYEKFAGAEQDVNLISVDGCSETMEKQPAKQNNENSSRRQTSASSNRVRAERTRESGKDVSQPMVVCDETRDHSILSIDRPAPPRKGLTLFGRQFLLLQRSSTDAQRKKTLRLPYASLSRHKPKGVQGEEQPTTASTIATVCGKAEHHVPKRDTSRRRHGMSKMLAGDQDPRLVKVRHTHKASCDCDFSHVWLTQEINLFEANDTLRKTNGGSSRDVQDIDAPLCCEATMTSEHRRATRAMRFSGDGRYLAVGSQDGVIRVFEVLDTPEKRQGILDALSDSSSRHSSPTIAPRTIRGRLGGSPHDRVSCTQGGKRCPSRSNSSSTSSGSQMTKAQRATPLPVLADKPIKEFRGHLNEILDLSWSKGGFLLSASADKTARVWHLSFNESLASFAHGDFVTSAVFHPRDDRFFLSGCLDGKLRLWNVPANKMQTSRDTSGLITSCAFTASGTMACAGLLSGTVLFYTTDGLRLSSSIAIKTAKTGKAVCKITGLEPIAPTKGKGDVLNGIGDERILITSNDSCVRVCEIPGKRIIARFKSRAYSNHASQIKASLSDDGMFIIAGSETSPVPSGNDSGHVVMWNCAAILAPTDMKSRILARFSHLRNMSPDDGAHDDGTSESSQASRKTQSLTKKAKNAILSETASEYFNAHAGTVTCAIMAPQRSTELLLQASDPCARGTAEKLQEANQGEIELSKVQSRSKTLAAAVSAKWTSAQLYRRKSLNDDRASAMLEEVTRNTRIIVSIDDNAILRVWRSDNLHVIGT